MSNNNIKNNWYQDFYTKFYFTYFHQKKDDVFQTKKEVDFICKILKLPSGAKILDLACGQGRHTLELALQNFDITGVDFNQQALGVARAKAQKNNLPIKFFPYDIRSLPFKNEFDAIICMYTSFGYFINEKENIKVLKGVAQSLKADGLFLLDLPNKYWTIHKIPRKTYRKFKNTSILESRSFDSVKKIFHNRITLTNGKNRIEKISTYLRLYDLKEIKNKLAGSGLKCLKSFGNYNIKINFETKKSPRMIVLAKKNN